MKILSSIFVLLSICLFIKAESTNFTISDRKDSIENITQAKMIGNVTIPGDLYEIVVKKALEQADCQHRKMIYESIEKMISAYNKRDIDLLKEGMSYRTIILWTKSDKPGVRQWGLKMKKAFDQYFEHLKMAYYRDSDVKAHIDNIEVMRHPVNPHFYGVTIKMGWNAENAHDEGYLFQLWDFTNGDNPQIHVITWQPEMVDGKPISRDEVYSLSDFDI